DSAAVVDLMQRQDQRLYGLDGRLRPPRSTETIQALLSEKVTADTVVAVDEQEHIRGLAIPGVWEIGEDDEIRGFFFPRNGTVTLTLPDPNEPEAAAVTHALLEAVEKWWQAQAVDGTLITWPAADGWLAALLAQRGYVADSAAAIRPLHPLMPLLETDRFTIRQAQPEDEETLVALHLEEIRFHEAHTPYSRVVPAIEPAFRQRLARVWRGERVEEGALLLLVAEQAGRVVGFTENWLSEMKGSWFPNGRYAYLNSVGVSEAARGRGIGRSLVTHTLQALAQYNIASFYLYYVLSNPLSSAFWPKMGFRPLLTTYKIAYQPIRR
ncbi:MAG: GNAT family N-acetyltransferase, partial [Ardenticatenaceae bacterium]|nr:GNAT family N-acetyltransferase [Ardenticatenaceae bacterium]